MVLRRSGVLLTSENVALTVTSWRVRVSARDEGFPWEVWVIGPGWRSRDNGPSWTGASFACTTEADSRIAMPISTLLFIIKNLKL